MIQLLQKSFAEHSNKVALVDGENSVTYSALGIAAKQASLVIEKIEQSVLVMDMDKSVEAISVMIASFEIQKPYLPINRKLPDKGKGLLMETLGVNVCIQDNLKLHYTTGNDHGLSIDKSYNVSLILSTSGSTGIPKLIPISNGNLKCFVEWAASTFLCESDVVYALSPLNFDMATFDIFSTLSVGATIVLPPPDTIDPLAHYLTIKNTSVSVLYATPSFIRQLYYRVKNKGAYKGLKKLLFAGEKLFPSDIEKAKTMFPDATMYNLYGPTETNVVTFTKVEADNHSVSIGKPCPYAEVDFIYEDAQTARGEICVAGASVFNGYLNAEYNKDCFVNIDGKQYYRTGDLGELKNGELFIYNRVDRVVKVNGYRVDLGEVEQTLLSFQYVDDVVCSFEDDKVIAILKLNGDVLTSQITEDLARHLPTYMIPVRFTFLEEIPRNDRNKIDYNLLRSIVNDSKG